MTPACERNAVNHCVACSAAGDTGKRRLVTYGGSCILAAKNNQSAASAAHPAKTIDAPPKLNSQPPKIPPIAAPKNWLVEYTPIAVPFAPAGATLLIKDGKLASSKLNAAKKIIVPMTNNVRLCPNHQKNNSLNNSTLIAPRNTRFILRCFSP